MLRGITVSLVSPSFMRRMSLAASRFLSRLQSSFRDTNPPRSSLSTYCNTHKHVWTHYDAQKQTNKTVCNLHERPWHYWRNTKNSHTGRSTVAWMPVTHRHKQTCKIIRSAVITTELFFSHLCNGYFLFLSLPHILSQEMDREWATAAVNLCPWISAILHLSQAHITRLYSIKMSLMREEVPRRVRWGCILFFVTSHIQIKTTREIIIDGYVSFFIFLQVQLCIWDIGKALQGSDCQNNSVKIRVFPRVSNEFWAMKKSLADILYVT